MTRIVSDYGNECNLLYELGFDGICNGPSSNQLRDDFFNIMCDKMKKLKCEMLEIDLRRQELNKNILEEDNKLQTVNSRKGSKSWLTNMIVIKKEPVEIKNEKLNKLLTECDGRIVELSNIFLNEKIDLIFRHNKEIDELNRRVSHLNKQLAKLGQTEFQTIEFEAETQTDLSGDFEIVGKKKHGHVNENGTQTDLKSIDFTSKLNFTRECSNENKNTQTDLKPILINFGIQVDFKKEIGETHSQTESTPISVADFQGQFDELRKETSEKNAQTDPKPIQVDFQTQSLLNSLDLVEMETKLASLKNSKENFQQSSVEYENRESQSELNDAFEKLVENSSVKDSPPKMDTVASLLNHTEVDLKSKNAYCQYDLIHKMNSETQTNILKIYDVKNVEVQTDLPNEIGLTTKSKRSEIVTVKDNSIIKPYIKKPDRKHLNLDLSKSEKDPDKSEFNILDWKDAEKLKSNKIPMQFSISPDIFLEDIAEESDKSLTNAQTDLNQYSKSIETQTFVSANSVLIQTDFQVALISIQTQTDTMVVSSNSILVQTDFHFLSSKSIQIQTDPFFSSSNSSISTQTDIFNENKVSSPSMHDKLPSWSNAQLDKLVDAINQVMNDKNSNGSQNTEFGFISEATEIFEPNNVII